MSTTRIILELPADVVRAARRAALHSRRGIPDVVTEALRKLSGAAAVHDVVPFADAEARLGLSRSQVWSLVRAGDIPAPERNSAGVSVWRVKR